MDVFTSLAPNSPLALKCLENGLPCVHGGLHALAGDREAAVSSGIARSFGDVPDGGRTALKAPSWKRKYFSPDRSAGTSLASCAGSRGLGTNARNGTRDVHRDMSIANFFVARIARRGAVRMLRDACSHRPRASVTGPERRRRAGARLRKTSHCTRRVSVPRFRSARRRHRDRAVPPAPRRGCPA